MRDDPQLASRRFASRSLSTEKRNREVLIAKRNLLFWQFRKDPKETELAIEIKAFDDRIAESTRRMVEEERKAQASEWKSDQPEKHSTET
jgi:hypothetical protein